MTVIQKGYGAIKLRDGGEVAQGELTLYAEGWVAVVPVPSSADDEPRWFPNERVQELVWRKSLATRRT